MTIRELYEWALEHQCEGYELLFTVEYPERSNVREDLLTIDDLDRTVTAD